MATSPLVNTIQFFRDFGLFDVLLPFLLTFTIVFAILEKTRILGTETRGNIQFPKRTLNTMVAFVIGMLVAATNKIVSAINQALPNVVFLAIIIICFLMLAGMFFKEGAFDFAEQQKSWTFGFMIVILVLIIGIFLDSLKTAAGISWLEAAFYYVINNISGPIVTSLMFLIVTVGAIYFIMGSSKEK